MKIGVLIDRLNVGGVEKCAIQEVRAMRKMGIDATLLVLSRRAVVEGAHKDLLEGQPVDYLEDRIPSPLRLDFKFPVFAFFSFFHFSYSFLLPIFIKNFEYDYILSHGSYTSFSAIGLKKLRRIPYSVYFWDPIDYIVKRVYRDKIPNTILSILSWIARFLDKLIVSNADHVFVPGEVFIDYFMNECGCKREKIKVVHPGTVLGKPTSNKGKHVLMVTTWKEGKNPNYVFEIVKRMPELKIKMAGGWLDQGMLESFKKKTADYGFQNNIELLGEANENRLLKLYPEAMVQLTTNLEKGFGMPVIEAAACGTVSIVPLGSGVCSVFENGVDAFYTDERDTAAIVRNIQSLVSDHKRAVSMGIKAYERVRKGHTWEAHSQKILMCLGVKQNG